MFLLDNQIICASPCSRGYSLTFTLEHFWASNPTLNTVREKESVVGPLLLFCGFKKFNKKLKYSTQFFCEILQI